MYKVGEKQKDKNRCIGDKKGIWKQINNSGEYTKSEMFKKDEDEEGIKEEINTGSLFY